MQRHPLNAAFLLFPLTLAACQPAMADDDVPTLFVTTQEGAIHCEGHDVNVVASNAKLTFSGRCNGVYFVGNGTTATIESTKLVQVTGTGIDVSAEGKVAEVYVIGKDNQLRFNDVGTLYLNSGASRIDAKSIDAIEAVGNGNMVRWSSGKPTINDMGRGNLLTPQD